MVTFISTDLEERFTKAPHNITHQLNGSNNTEIRIACIPPNGYPLVTVSWKRRLDNGTIIPVQEVGRIKIKEGLKISNVQVDDTGFYQCVASNGYYERLSDFVYLNILPSE